MSADPVAPESEDNELRAATALHAQIQKTRRKASLASLLGGLAVGFVLAAIGSSVFADLLGPRIGMIGVAIVFFAPILAALKVAAVVADGIVKKNIAAWMRALAKEHGVAESTLEDHARIAGAIEAP